MPKAMFLLLDKRSPVFTPLVELLPDMGFKDVHEARGTNDALTLLRTFDPDIVAIDWNLSTPERMTEFLQKFRKLEGKRSTSILVLASEFTPSLIAIASEYNVAKLMMKSTLKLALKPAIQAIMQERAQPSPVKTMLLKLEDAMEKSKPGELDAIIEEFYTHFPDHPRAQLEYGNLALRKGRIEDARKIAQRALAGAPNNLRAMNLLSRVLMREGKRQEALDVLSQAELVSPKNLERLVMLGDCFIQLGDYQKARATYSDALDVDAESPDARRGMGVVELNDGDVNKALDLFRDSATEEELAGFFNTAAIVAVKAGNFDKGVQLYESAKLPIKKPQLLAKVFFNMGLAFRKWNKVKKAEECFERALDFAPKFEKAKLQIEDLRKQHILGNIGEAAPMRTAALEETLEDLGFSVDNNESSNSESSKIVPEKERAIPQAPSGIQVKDDKRVISPFSVQVLNANTPQKAAPKPTPKPAITPKPTPAPSGNKPGKPKFLDDDDEI